MRSTCSFVSALVLLGCAIPLATGQTEESDRQTNPRQVDFVQHIRPLLSDRCFACHGPDAEHRQADLRLDQLENLSEDRGGYRIVVPGQPEESELLRRITSESEYEVMPPPEGGGPLTPAERELFQRWIEQGAEWEQHWAYQLPQRAPPSAIEIPTQIGDDIDSYIAREFAAVDGKFSNAADRITLARRLSFDLVGLPPTPEEVERFMEDNSSFATSRFVDRLLAQPAFGERMAVWWLDLVRYADTVGYHGDQDHNISLYRDYVIQAFNDGLSFDRFTIEQLAGDLLPEPTEEQIIATGYNRLLQTSHEGGVQPKEYLAIYAADRVRNVSAVWMGATVGCAQCHDHKYDPFTAQDFYALAAFFADVDEEQHFSVGTNTLPTRRPPEEKFLDRAARLELTQLEGRLHTLEDVLQSTASDGTSVEPQQELEEEIGAVQRSIDDIKQSSRTTMITVATEPRTIRYLPRGNWLDDSGPVMEPAVPAFMGKLNTGARRATRLDLARWLVDADEGAGLLTARVLVNRLWMLMFGEGLSRSVEDFGGQGEPPSHPELLDHLAIEFVAAGWDVKSLLRKIALSRTYQQSSLEAPWHREYDPLNRLLSRQHRFRIPAEMIRDTALRCGDLLVERVGGASVKPYQPADYYRHLNFPTREYQPSTDEGQWRRGVYVHWQRQFLHPMLRAFDAPTREECTAQRTQSNTPLAALVWLNDPTLLEAARGLAFRVIADDSGKSETAGLEHMFELAISRRPDPQEMQMLSRLLATAQAYYEDKPREALELLSVGAYEIEKSRNPERLAAWTTVARALLNLNETYARN